MATVEIGNGTVVTGNFSTINWASGPCFIKTETDPVGGTSYSITGNKQLMSVPYALYAANGGATGAGAGSIGSTGATGAGIYILNSSNYTSIAVPSDNYAAVQGNITLAANYSGLNGSHLVINGGTITGNGSYVLAVGYNCVFNGVTFNAVDLDCQWATFINCTFTGNCPRIGYDSKFNNCQFSGVTTGFIYLLGSVVNSSVANSTLPRCNEFIGSSITGSTIGSEVVNQCAISNISACYVSTSSIYALQSDFVFTNNRCSSSSIFLNNATQVCNQATISNNQFRSGISTAPPPDQYRSNKFRL